MRKFLPVLLCLLLAACNMPTSESDAELNDHLNDMPNLEKLLDDHTNSVNTPVNTKFPPTTFSSTASQLTGLYPKDHKVPGDNKSS